jgi:hypothetical protein
VKVAYKIMDDRVEQTLTKREIELPTNLLTQCESEDEVERLVREEVKLDFDATVYAYVSATEVDNFVGIWRTLRGGGYTKKNSLSN